MAHEDEGEKLIKQYVRRPEAHNTLICYPHQISFKILRDMRNTKQLTAVHVAASKGHTEILKRLLDSEKLSKDEVCELLNIQDLWGWTPIHHAACYGEMETIVCILELADPAESCLCIKDNVKSTPYDVAVKYNQTTVVDFFQQRLRLSKQVSVFPIDEY